jgi:hypothetical protein
MGLLGTVTLRGASAAARYMLQIENEHTRQLNQLMLGVDALLSGPYNAALEDLEIAAKADTSPESAASHLVDAQKSFTLAYGNLKKVDPLQSAWAAVHMAIICTATQRRGEALHWASLAHERATEAMNLLDAQVNDKAEMRMGRLKLNSESSEMVVITGGVAAAFGITIASGGLALPAFAVAGAAAASAKGMEMFRNRRRRKEAAKVYGVRQFLDDVNSLKEQLGDSQPPELRS